MTRVILLDSGICYQAEDCKVKSPFPLSCILSTCLGHITFVYKTLLEYDTGAAVEFLFAAQALSVGITVEKASQNPSRLKPSLYVHQTEAGMCESETTISCILIKLVKKHPAVDFVIIDNPAGKDSKKLFLVQVSAQKYQNCGGEHRYQQHFPTYVCFKEESPLDVYLRKTGVLSTNWHFVYASTADSTVNKEDTPFVYLCNLTP